MLTANEKPNYDYSENYNITSISLSYILSLVCSCDLNMYFAAKRVQFSTDEVNKHTIFRYPQSVYLFPR